jgi:hypothetical protein
MKRLEPHTKRVLNGDELYEMVVLRDEGRCYWAVIKSGRSRTGSWNLGVVHAGGEAASEGDAWRQARRVLPYRARSGAQPREILFLRPRPRRQH